MGESFTIQISSSLVNRLASEGEKKKRLKKSKPKTSRLPHQPPSKAAPHQKQTADKIERPSGWPLQSPLFMPLSPPPPAAADAELAAKLDAIRSILQESESVIERLQKQEANMVEEVTQRAKELREKEFKLPYERPIRCLAEKDACLECYKEHTKDPLKCANVVKTFADCARKLRQQVTSPLSH